MLKHCWPPSSIPHAAGISAKVCSSRSYWPSRHLLAASLPLLPLWTHKALNSVREAMTRPHVASVSGGQRALGPRIPNWAESSPSASPSCETRRATVGWLATSPPRHLFAGAGGGLERDRLGAIFGNIEVDHSVALIRTDRHRDHVAIPSEADGGSVAHRCTQCVGNGQRRKTA